MAAPAPQGTSESEFSSSHTQFGVPGSGNYGSSNSTNWSSSSSFEWNSNSGSPPPGVSSGLTPLPDIDTSFPDFGTSIFDKNPFFKPKNFKTVSTVANPLPFYPSVGLPYAYKGPAYYAPVGYGYGYRAGYNPYYNNPYYVY